MDCDHRHAVDAVRYLVEEVFADRDIAERWFSQPLASFRDRTPLQLMVDERGEDVIAYLHSIASGFVG